MSKQHFIEQEKQISNTYMSANGTPPMIVGGPGITSPSTGEKVVVWGALGIGALLTLAVPVAIIYIAYKMSQK